jgi:hypothetical protein
MAGSSPAMMEMAGSSPAMTHENTAHLLLVRHSRA